MSGALSFGEAFRVWSKIGVISFGGPAGQIALMQRIVVDEKGWLTERQFLNALGFCMLLPGPEAMQLATYAGWRMHGVRGGLAAGGMFVLPGAIVIATLASLYVMFGSAPLVAALFTGIKAAVVIIVIEALLKVAKRALNGVDHWIIAAAAFIALFFFNFPYPLIVLLAGLYGFICTARSVEKSVEVRPAYGDLVKTTALWLTIWWAPLLAVMVLAPNSVLSQLGVFFSKLAVVTFGGAYAVLAYMAQDVVDAKAWLTAGEMLDGLGLAETTPGPLILVTEFVGFLAGFKNGGWGTAFAAAAVTLWATFIPCFLWIFAGAPYIEWISANPRLRGALAAITAAVVGVILKLSLWFALHVFFLDLQTVQFGLAEFLVPDASSIDWQALAISVLAGVLLLVRHWNLMVVLFVCGLSGMTLSFLG
ncbi:chromate efflux transporter [Pseudahrensia aquimaris]|uniref:Chromate efflux transporter n=1 Tax=Pseudahrensia aquimaris TaxID=744461 RepID=A0ABW3FFZ7_9HYPH